MSSSHFHIVRQSTRHQGRDTIPHKATNFIDLEAIQPPPPPPEPKYEMWTDDHVAFAKHRREQRENRVKPSPVADVPDFDYDEHINQLETEKQKKSKWKLW